MPFRVSPKSLVTGFLKGWDTRKLNMNIKRLQQGIRTLDIERYRTFLKRKYVNIGLIAAIATVPRGKYGVCRAVVERPHMPAHIPTSPT